MYTSCFLMKSPQKKKEVWRLWKFSSSPQVMMQAQADRVYLALPALLSPHQSSPGEVVQYFLLQSVSG